MSWSGYLLDGIDFSDITVMDAGTGMGGTTLLLARRIAKAGGKGKILSVDIDPEAFEEAEKSLGEYARFV